MWTDTTRAHHARAGLVLPSDFTDADWVLLEPFLPPPFCVARPRKWPMRRIVEAKPRLLSDNGPSYIAGELAEYIEAQKMSHMRGAPFHPQTQGKIERWHQTLKNRILLENYFLPGDLEAQIEAFVEHYNHQRYHESLSNVTPADAYFGRAPAIMKQRERIKKQTIEHRRLQHRKLAA